MKHFIYFSLLLVLSSCDFSNEKPRSTTFWIDNPLETPITISIDGKKHEIAANSQLLLELKSGRHSLDYNNEQINFVVKPNDQQVIMNPTLSNYVFYNEIYSEIGKNAEEEVERAYKAYLYDYYLPSGDTVKVPFKLVSDFFIGRYNYYWHLNPTEPFPNTAKINKGGSNLSTAPQSKIFREHDFYSYIGEELAAEFRFPKNETKLSDLKPFEFMPDSLHFDCAPAEKVLQLKRAQFDSLQTADHSEMRALYNRFSNQKDMSNVRNECSPSDNKSLDPNSNYGDLEKVMSNRVSELSENSAFIVK
ncbi:hypothetical protein AwDysgo_08920 [Bacteroidales bacterium]|nr:hypothetical protein AwDysgo_08920 [Bacteroidales bacterium]